MANTKTSNKSKKAEPKPNGQGNSQLEKFFLDSLKDIYWAEKHLTKALPKMQKAATTEELQSAIEEHITQTEEHVARLEQVFEMLGKKPQAKKCDAMEGLVKEAQGLMDELPKGTMVRDAGLIIAAQKVEHYEIATYGTLRVFAKTMGHKEVYDLLSKTLENEKATDVALTKIAEGFVNKEAAAE